MREFIVYGRRVNIIRVVSSANSTKPENERIGVLRDGAIYGEDGKFLRRLLRPRAVAVEKAYNAPAYGVSSASA